MERETPIAVLPRALQELIGDIHAISVTLTGMQTAINRNTEAISNTINDNRESMSTTMKESRSATSTSPSRISSKRKSMPARNPRPTSVNRRQTDEQILSDDLRDMAIDGPVDDTNLTRETLQVCWIISVEDAKYR